MIPLRAPRISKKAGRHPPPWGRVSKPLKKGLRATHYFHMHTSRGCVCLGAWGYRGMYA